VQSVITLYAKPGTDGFIRFGVRDQGPGISEENLPRVFEKFYRVPGQTRRGAGLGLTIAREIVVAHGGTIACASKLGEGSDFYFFIPTGKAERTE
jgi:signal transduction histidine kinase